jgi:signal transduction histidine kinase
MGDAVFVVDHSGAVVLTNAAVEWLLGPTLCRRTRTGSRCRPRRRPRRVMPPRLSQVVLNLLTNAAKHAPHSRRVEVRLRREAGEALLEVQDYGPGIPAEALPHLFDRFYHAARRSAEDGLGVGLFITRVLVRAHGGAIEVRCAEGDGTTFTVRLPLLVAPEQAGPTSPPEPPGDAVDTQDQQP